MVGSSVELPRFSSRKWPVFLSLSLSFSDSSGYFLLLRFSFDIYEPFLAAGSYREQSYDVDTLAVDAQLAMAIKDEIIYIGLTLVACHLSFI